MRAAGIDVGKARLDLAIDGQAGVVGFANDRAGIAKLLKRLARLGVTRIVVEATGGYEEPLLEACCDAGLWIARVNPRQARAFANATGELMGKIDASGDWNDEIEAAFVKGIEEFKATGSW